MIQDQVAIVHRDQGAIVHRREGFILLDVVLSIALLLVALLSD